MESAHFSIDVVSSRSQYPSKTESMERFKEIDPFRARTSLLHANEANQTVDQCCCKSFAAILKHGLTIKQRENFSVRVHVISSYTVIGYRRVIERLRSKSITFFLKNSCSSYIIVFTLSEWNCLHSNQQVYRGS
jgi:hypothetical protein